MVDDVAEAFRELEAWHAAGDGRVVSMLRGSSHVNGQPGWIVVLYGPDDLAVAKMHSTLPAAVEAALRAAGGGE